MGRPQTINGLMRHLRNDCNIQIKGSFQKQQLISYGYYHGYKGYRFIKTNITRFHTQTLAKWSLLLNMITI